MAWAWDDARAASMLADAGGSAGARLWPETLLTGPATTPCVRLVRAVEGVDGQVWRGGDLLASRWWPQMPDTEEWARWARTAAFDVESAGETLLPPVEEPHWQRPWAEGSDLDAMLSNTSRMERVALGASLIGLVGLSAAQAHQAWSAYVDRRELLEEQAQVAALAAPVQGARDRALALADEATALSGQLVAVQPLEVLQHLAETLPPHGVTLTELELNGTRLRVALEAGPEISRSAIVKDLQAPGWFAQVAEVRDGNVRNGLMFEMQVKGLRPPPGPATARPSSPLPSATPLPGAPGLLPGLPQPTPQPQGARP